MGSSPVTINHLASSLNQFVMNHPSVKAAINYLVLVSLIYIVITVFSKLFYWIV